MKINVLPEQRISIGRRISQLAAEHPQKAVIAFLPDEGDERIITWRELDETSTRLARLMEERGVRQGSMVVIGLKNSPEHYFAAHAALKLGATVLPVSYRVPPLERDAILELANPSLVVADWGETAFSTLSSEDSKQAFSYSATPLPERISDPAKAMGSGGSTGRPKIIVNPGPWAWVPGELADSMSSLGFRAGQVQIVAGPLYHNSPYGASNLGLFEDHTIVLFERFDAARVVDAIERYRVSYGFFSPTMMQRIVQLPGVEGRDFSSIEGMYHTAAPCPEWVKRAWMKLIPPERVYEGFGSTEAVGVCSIRGDEWLEHPGSVGRMLSCALRILDEEGKDVPVGEVGEIFTRPKGMVEQPYYYIGSPPVKSTLDGFMSVGDMGRVDEDGYLFLADRRVDLIITGAANVYPAEVEAALSGHPDVVDVAVIGLPDTTWGKRVHAIIQPRDTENPPTVAGLNVYARERLMPYKVPKTYEFVQEFPRDLSGKLRRTQLVEERSMERQ